MKIEGSEKVNKEYESVQKKIDKLLLETSEEKTNKTYQEMQTDEDYRSAVKKIGKLMMKLEKIEEENRKNKRGEINA